MKTLYLILFSWILQSAVAQQISPAGIYAASGSGKANNAGIDWILGSINMQPALSAFPVRLISFQVRADHAGHARLEWKTSGENGNQGFEIQKSTDARNFEKIGWVSAAQTDDGITIYHFEDEHFITTSYYRLKQLDLDGKYSFSRIVPLIPANEMAEQLIVFPNPTADGHVDIILPDKTLEMKITNINGAILKQIKSPQPRQTFQMPSSGTYLINIKTAQEEKTVKVVRK